MPLFPGCTENPACDPDSRKRLGSSLFGMGELESQIHCIFAPPWGTAMLGPNHRGAEEQKAIVSAGPHPHNFSEEPERLAGLREDMPGELEIT
jgi:hypothetical protein